MLDIPPRGRKLSKVRACQGQSEVVAACESCSPCLVHTSPPHPPMDCHMPGPPGPPSQCCKIPVGVVGVERGLFTSTPYPTLPQASEGTLGWRGPYGRC